MTFKNGRIKNNKTFFSFICCIYNEINVAPTQLNNLIKIIKKNNLEEKSEIILIDNNSSDGSREWINSISNNLVRKKFNNINIGKGGSIKVGIKESRGVIGIIFDLDGEYKAEDAIKGCKLIKKTNSIICLSSRVLNKKKPNHIYFINYLGVIFLTKIINLIYKVNLTDAATGLKIINIEFFKKNIPSFNGFNVDFELICLALNKKKSIVEFTGEYIPRTIKDGKKIKALPDGISSLAAIIITFIRR